MLIDSFRIIVLSKSIGIARIILLMLLLYTEDIWVSKKIQLWEKKERKRETTAQSPRFEPY